MAEEEVKASNMRALREYREMMFRQDGNPLLPLPIANGLFQEENANDEDSKLECLGVAPLSLCVNLEGNPLVNLIKKDSVFGQLPRPAKLPLTECPITVVSPSHSESQEFVTGLWNGLFAFQVAEHIPETMEEGALKLLIWVRSKTTKEICQMGLLKYGFDGGNQYFKAGFSDHIGHLNENHVTLLGARVLHHILREWGWMFPWPFLDAMFRTLQNAWSQSKKYKRLSLDLRLIMADLEHNIPHAQCEDTIEIAMFLVGLALDALGRFKESEALFLEVAQKCSLASPDKEARAYIFASNSCMSDLRHEDALRHLLKGLRILTRVPNSFDWSKGDLNGAISNLVVIHHVICQEKLHESYDGNGKHKLGLCEKMFASLGCLLTKAEFVPEDSSYNTILAHTDLFMPRLKIAYHQPIKAKQMLIRSFHSEGVEAYKETLLAAVLGGEWVFLMDAKEIAGAFDERTRRRGARRRAQHRIKEIYYERRAVRTCFNCFMAEPTSETFKDCPCRITCYCSKECQMEHWKSHKRTCPWCLEQKQKPKNG